MLSIFVDFVKNKDIRKKFLFTFLILFIYVLGSTIPVPGVNTTLLKLSSQSLLSMMSMMGGGSIEQMSVFALGVGPYITASIITQLLSMDIIPALAEMAKNGKNGQKQIDRINRYLTVVIGLVQGYFIVNILSNGYGVVDNPTFSTYLYISVVMVAGTMALLWLADQITTKGIGNGVSMIIFAGIVAKLPSTFTTVYFLFIDGSSLGYLKFAGYVLMYVLIIVGVIVVQLAERRIAIQQSTRSAFGFKDTNFLPLKINSASVIPVIFANALMQAPLIVSSWFSSDAYDSLTKIIDFSNPIFLLVYAIIIVAFTFFYTNLQVNPSKIAENLGKNGQYIPGIRPGTETEEYISRILNRITWFGAIALAILAVLPYMPFLPQQVALGGTGIIIVVGVAIETIKGLKGQITKKRHRGF